MLNAVKRPRKLTIPTDADARKHDRLDLIEERVLRLRYGSVPAPEAPLGRKTEDPVVLADLERLERALVQRLSRAGTSDQPAAAPKAPRRRARSARS